MISAKDLKEWLATISDDAMLAIDEGGLILEVISGDQDEAPYIEIGGDPANDPYSNEEATS